MDADVESVVREHSIELHSMKDLDSLIEKVGDARYVLLGEASHGTHEYYTMRMQITRKLIEEKGFSFIAVEGDWPDCYKINRYIKGHNLEAKSAFDVLQEFRRWPTWMWANWEVVALLEWMKVHNKKFSKDRKIGFYGLDVYSLSESLDAVLKYLDRTDKKTMQSALNALKCFEPYADKEGQSYAQSTLIVPDTCEQDVVNLLKDIRKNLTSYNSDAEAVFSAEQNAFIAVNAEAYYRAMVRPGPNSWNIRDHHMVDTLNKLMDFHGAKAKAIVWEHNTHIGDARATEMNRQGMVNVGQLVREENAETDVFTVGFGSYVGTVLAGSEWGGVIREMNMPPAKDNSWESILHGMEGKDRIVFMTDDMKEQIGHIKIDHRAVGVVYHPRNEYLGNYVASYMPYRYDAFVFLDHTKALHPIHLSSDSKEIPETYPFGF